MKATHDELEKIDRLIDLAFDEDIAQGDLTTESNSTPHRQSPRHYLGY